MEWKSQKISENSVFKLNIPNLSLNDEDFVSKVHTDIERFLYYQPTGSVLLFPPVNNYRRFLIHQTCENFRNQYDLHTFSVGQGLSRRTVVCFQHQLLQPHNNSLFRGTETQISNKNQLPRPSASSHVAGKEKHSNMGAKKQSTETRSGKASELNLYRPPALRNAIEKLTSENTANNDMATTTTTKKVAASLSTRAQAQQVVKSGQTENEDNIGNITMTLMPNIINSNNKQQTTSTNITLNTNAADNPLNIMKESNSACDIGVRQQALTRRERRPDRAVYIPRARRSQTTPPTTTTGVSTTMTTTMATAVTTSTSSYSKSECLVGTLSSHRSDEIHNISSNSDNNIEMTKPSTTAISSSNNNNSGRSKIHLRRSKNNTKSSSTTTTTTATTNTLLNDIDKNIIKKKKSSQDDKGTASTSAGKAFLANTLNHRTSEKNNHNNNGAITTTKQKTMISLPNEISEKKMSAIKKDIHNNDIAMPANYHECLSKNYNDGVNLSEVKKNSDCDKMKIASNNNKKSYGKDFKVNDHDNDGNDDGDDNNDSQKQNKLIKSDNITTYTTTTTTNTLNKIININNQSQQFNGGVRIEDLHENARLIENNKNNKKPLKSDDIEEQELKRASKEINRSNRRIMKQTFASDVLEIPEKLPATATTSMDAITNNCVPKTHETHIYEQAIGHVGNDVIENGHGGSGGGGDGSDDWDTMYDESGKCLDPKIVQEITDTLGKVKIDLPEMDYSMYLSNQLILEKEGLPHVLEVSNFPAEFKHQDLLMIFAQYKESGFDIKWVDDTHALAVFSSARIAAEVLTKGHPFAVLKPLAEATVESRLKAKKCATSLQPYRPRPATCAALARRLVTGALGVRLKTAAAERENEKRVLKLAKERKMLAAKQRDEMWEN